MADAAMAAGMEALDKAGRVIGKTVLTVAGLLTPGPEELLLAKGAPLIGRAASRAAGELGFTRRIAPQRAHFDSHGQPVFTDGRRYITPDVDQHSGGVWKMYDRKGQRIGTYDADLNYIGK
jgi:filamentous hemagglutinin